MKIAVAGTGYVGLSIATLLSQHHAVTAVDVIPEKVDLINQHKSPIRDEYIEKYMAEAKSGQRRLNLTATLDGELTRIADGVKGVYEGKTAEIGKKIQWEEWKNKVPNNYYIQLCQQLYCVGEEYRFSILNAKLKRLNGDSEIRAYEFIRDEMEEDIRLIVNEAKRFWKYVETDKRPPIRI